MTVAAYLRDAAEARPEALAVATLDTKTSYAELDSRARRVAHALLGEMGLSPGDRVAIALPNDPAVADVARFPIPGSPLPHPVPRFQRSGGRCKSLFYLPGDQSGTRAVPGPSRRR